MKIWNSYGSEHSSNLVIIGEFNSVEDAGAAAEFLRQLFSIAAEEFDNHGDYISDRLGNFSKQHNMYWTVSEAQALGLDHDTPRTEGKKLIITTEEMDVMPVLRTLVKRGAKVQIFSGHDHASPYNRR